MRILFVCTGNTCRSPMAEKLLRKMAKEQGVDIEVKSAGVFASSGSTASVNATRVLEGRGITEEHRSQSVSSVLMDWADLIITMTEAHKQSLFQEYPDCAEKIYTLKEYTDTSEGTTKRLEELDELYDRLEEKQEAFMREHRDEIRQLEDRYQELYSQLELVREQLDDWRDRIMQATVVERNQISILEQQTPDYDISDPFGGTVETYENCAKEIESSLVRLLELMKKS